MYTYAHFLFTYTCHYNYIDNAWLYLHYSNYLYCWNHHLTNPKTSPSSPALPLSSLSLVIPVTSVILNMMWCVTFFLAIGKNMLITDMSGQANMSNLENKYNISHSQLSSVIQKKKLSGDNISLKKRKLDKWNTTYSSQHKYCSFLEPSHTLIGDILEKAKVR